MLLIITQYVITWYCRMAKILLSQNSLFGEIEAVHNRNEKLATAHWVSEDFKMGKGIAVNF